MPICSMKTIAIITAMLTASTASASDVKEADLAGSWYTASGPELERELKGYLSAASPEKAGGRIFAVISPHAGYRFSGPVAAYSFKAVEGAGF